MSARPQFRQHILPLECVEDRVENGVSITTLLTPEECNELLNPTLPGVPSHPTSPINFGSTVTSGIGQRSIRFGDLDSSWMDADQALTVPGNAWLSTAKTGVVSYHDSQQGQFYDPTTVIIPILVSVSFILVGVWLGADHVLRHLLAKR